MNQTLTLTVPTIYGSAEITFEVLKKHHLGTEEIGYVLYAQSKVVVAIEKDGKWSITDPIDMFNLEQRKPCLKK